MPLVTSSRKASESSVTGMQQVPLLAFLMPGRMWHRNPASAARQDGDQQEQWPPGQGQCQARAMPYRGGARTYTTRPVMWLGHMVPPGSAPRAGYMLDAESGGSGMWTSRVSESLPGSPLSGHLRRSGLPARRGTGVPGNGISLTLFRSGRRKPGLSPLVTVKFGEPGRGCEDLRVTLLKC